MTQGLIEKLKDTRHHLHQYPELSGLEVNTVAFLKEYIHQVNQDAELIEIGSGLLAIFGSSQPGPTTMIRAELDALPIAEANDFSHRSGKPGISHKCGHDGHMSILLGMAHLLTENPPEKGRVILLFQSAEESGEGAKRMLEEPEFEMYKSDHAFALHNLPGYPLGQVILKPGTFCSASVGLKIKLTGHTAHASDPETGKSPAYAMTRMANLLVAIPQADAFRDFVLVTLTHMCLGEPTFGVSPGEGEMQFTLRAYHDQDLELLQSLVRTEAESIAAHEKVAIEFSWHEAFNATVNDEQEVSRIEEIAKELGLEYRYLDAPNRWSEDFGRFLQHSKGALFGLGSGEDCRPLHHPAYDFPDELIETGVQIFWRVLQKLNY